jgi:hypothetical protein
MSPCFLGPVQTQPDPFYTGLSWTVQIIGVGLDRKIEAVGPARPNEPLFSWPGSNPAWPVLYGLGLDGTNNWSRFRQKIEFVGPARPNLFSGWPAS